MGCNMILNTETNKIKTPTDCLTCEFWDKRLKKCNGIGKKCFEYDALTGTILDPITKLPIKKVEKEK